MLEANRSAADSTRGDPWSWWAYRAPGEPADDVMLHRALHVGDWGISIGNANL